MNHHVEEQTANTAGYTKRYTHHLTKAKKVADEMTTTVGRETITWGCTKIPVRPSRTLLHMNVAMATDCDRLDSSSD